MAKYNLLNIINMYKENNNTLNDLKYVQINVTDWDTDQWDSFGLSISARYDLSGEDMPLLSIYDVHGNFFNIGTIYLEEEFQVVYNNSLIYYWASTNQHANSSLDRSIIIDVAQLSTCFIDNNFIEVLEENPIYCEAYTIKVYLLTLINKLKRKHEELDYYISLAETWGRPECAITSPISGVTYGDTLSCSLIGNLLHIYVSLTLTSAAQTTIGTGDITNRTICYVFFKNIYTWDVNAVYGSGFGSSYSAGNAQPATFYAVPRRPSDWKKNTAYSVSQIVIYNNNFYQCSTAHTSGTSFSTTNWTTITKPSGMTPTKYGLIVQIYIDSLVTSTTNYRLYCDLPVARQPKSGSLGGIVQ